MNAPRSALRKFSSALLAALLPLSLAQAGWTDDYIATADLSEHVPRAAAISRSDSDELRLFAVTGSFLPSQQGLAERRFKRVRGQPNQGWAAWVHRGKPAGASDPAEWQRFLPITAGWQPFGTDVLGFFGFPQSPAASSEKIGIARLASSSSARPPYATLFRWEPAQDPPRSVFPLLFNPQTVAASSISSDLDVFGTNSDDAQPGIHGSVALLRLHARPNSGAWTFGRAQDLGQPTLGGKSGSVALGPQSTASALLGQTSGPAVNKHFVFVKAVLDVEDRVTFSWGDEIGGAFSWGIDLGTPRADERIVDGPLAVVWPQTVCNPACLTFSRVSVWVTTFDRGADRFTLFERHFDARVAPASDPMKISQWTPWQSFGTPTGLSGKTPFRMTSGVVWYAGSTMRINLFGYTDSDKPVPERLVEFYWDGSHWQWAAAPVTAPGGAGFRTMSATVLQSPLQPPRTYVRLSVFGRTAGVGKIWERFYVMESGYADSGWQWLDLSYECLNDGSPGLCAH